jgi:hypothetical protein
MIFIIVMKKTTIIISKISLTVNRYIAYPKREIYKDF